MVLSVHFSLNFTLCIDEFNDVNVCYSNFANVFQVVTSELNIKWAVSFGSHLFWMMCCGK